MNIICVSSLNIGDSGASSDWNSQVGCYGNYCGINSYCDNSASENTPNHHIAPIDSFDAACFLHDTCYGCTTGSSCCPDNQYYNNITKVQCDELLLQRMKNDNLCSSASNPVQCKLTLTAAIAIFEGLVPARQEINQYTTNSNPTMISSPQLSCDSYSCPYSHSSSCFIVCGSSTCNNDPFCNKDTQQTQCPDKNQVCNQYTHTCFDMQQNNGEKKINNNYIIYAILSVISIVTMMLMI